MRSPTHTRERARPLLGTIVRIRVAAGCGGDRAIDAAFAEIASIHALMSFQEPDSDLSRIGRAAPGEAVAVDWRTRDCLAMATNWSAASNGAFDPVAAVSDDADWRDLAIDGSAVQPTRTLRVDLSGIAKGYAVDRACEVLAAYGMTSGMVEAGGDLRVFGPVEEEIALRPAGAAPPALIALSDGALASSDPAFSRTQDGASVHLDGRTRLSVGDDFVAVAAPRCVDADAFTKIVLALGDAAEPLLAGKGATAYRFDGSGWSIIGGRL